MSSLHTCRWPSLLGLALCLWISQPAAQAAVYTCQQSIDAATLGGKSVWLSVESGQLPYESTGAYHLDLHADGTYSVPASGAIQARSGTWTAARPAEYLIITLTGFHGDAVPDVLVLFDTCPSCFSCSYNIFRENVASSGQSGTFVVTDGETPPTPPADIGVRGLSGGGTYQSGANISLLAEINYVGNPSNYKFQWTRDGTPVASAIPGFLMLNSVTAADSGTYAIRVSKSGVTNVLAAKVTVLPPEAAPGYQGRTWTKLSDWVAGTPAGRTWFRVHNGVLTMGGDKSVSRWADGKLEQLVNSTTPGIDGIGFSWVDAVTIESEGAFNFVVRNKLYEMRAGSSTLIPTPGLSVGAVSRSGHQVVFVANSGGIQNGLYLWNGTELRTLLAPSLDLPGKLTGMESVKSLSFDGERVVLVAAAGLNSAVFAVTVGNIPTPTLLADSGSAGPSGQTYKSFYGASLRGDLVFLVAELNPYGTSTVSIERSGKATRLGAGFSMDLVNASIAANGTREFHHLDATALEHWENSAFERYLGPGEKLDGKTINRITYLDASGDDVVAAFEFTDNTAAIYGLRESVAPPTPVQIGLPILVGQQLQFTVPTVAGGTYALEKKADLGEPVWTLVETFAGDGNPHNLSVAAVGAGSFFRIVQRP